MKSAKYPESPSAANALAIKFAKVIPICIVDKNSEGSSYISTNFLAILSPSSAIFFNLILFVDIKATSVIAKKAFIIIKTS